MPLKDRTAYKGRCGLTITPRVPPPRSVMTWRDANSLADEVDLTTVAIGKRMRFLLTACSERTDRCRMIEVVKLLTQLRCELEVMTPCLLCKRRKG